MSRSRHNQGSRADTAVGRDRPTNPGTASKGSWWGLSAPLILFLFAAFLGGFHSGAVASSVIMGMAILVACALYAAWRAEILDPLRLGQALERTPKATWRRAILGLLPWLVLLVGLGALANSPVPRSGRLALCLFPWGLMLVPAMARSTPSPERRAVAQKGFALSLAVVSAWALHDWFTGSPRPAMPLGHHGLLALWLVAIMPVAVLPTLLQPAHKAGLAGRLSVQLVAALGLLTLLATRSLAGALGLSAQVLWIAWRGFREPHALAPRARRGRRVLAMGAALMFLAVVAAPRLVTALRVGDRSVEARWVYLVHAFEGLAARPWLGWGPGSSSWTAAQFGGGFGQPGGEVVTDLHSLPAEILYESGVLGFLGVLVVAAAWIAARARSARSASRSSEARAWTQSVGAGALGLLVSATVSGFFDVMAIWLLIPVLLGLHMGVEVEVAAALQAAPERSAAEPRRTAESGVPKSHTWERSGHWVVALGMLLVLVLAWVPIRPLLAQLSWQESQRRVDEHDRSSNIQSLERAVLWDPAFPLYRSAFARALARASQYRVETVLGPSSPGRESLRAARDAVGLAPLFLEAGFRLREEVLPQEDIHLELALGALRRACDLNASDPMAPFLLATTAPAPAQPRAEGDASSITDSVVRDRATVDDVVHALARAILADPRLMVTPELLARPDLRALAVHRLERLEAVPVGWRAALVDAENALPDAPTAVLAPINLTLLTDQRGETSMALFAYRRRAAPAEIARIAIDGERASAIEIPPAYELLEFASNPRRAESLLSGDCRLSASRGIDSAKSAP